MMRRAYDFLIVGGGVMGINIARVLNARYPDAKLGIVEKERDVAFHASGRNSGVLHAGFYYTAESLKAKFTRDGNRAMREYCLSRKLPLECCGKVVVAVDDNDIPGIEELKRRGDANGIELHWIDEKQTAEIEPAIRFYKKALYSPATASMDPLLVCQRMSKELREKGVDIGYEQKYVGRTARGIKTDKGEVEADTVINAAGLYADQIAHDYGFGGKYTLIPFKGIYLKSAEAIRDFRTHIYPVPNIANPFLGVHFTITVDKHVKIGPTAAPAFWRENYSWFSRFSAPEMMETVYCDMRLFWRNDFQFRSLAVEEIRKYWRNYMLMRASRMVKQIDPAQFRNWSRPGIRAQLYNTETGKLVQDFVVEGNRKSWHVLNAVSPAFTCSIPFSNWIVDRFMAMK